MRYKMYWTICFLIVTSLSCASVKEAAKGVAGLSTRELEESRKGAIIKTFNYDYAASYNKVKDILVERGSYIYAKDFSGHMIAIYVSSEDTTKVGIFFKEIDANTTQIEVASPSTYAKEFIAGRIFSALEGTPDLEEKKGLFDAKD